jgi:hypothetical protein
MGVRSSCPSASAVACVVPEPKTSGMKYHSVEAVQPLRSFAKQFGLGFHPQTQAFGAIPMLAKASEWAGPPEKNGKSQRFSLRFPSLRASEYMEGSSR